jgi:translation initiation factor 3 subunit C
MNNFSSLFIFFQSWNDQDWYNKANANHFRQKLRRYLKQQSIPHETINDDKSVEQKHAIVNLSREEEILAKLDEINSMRGKRGINYQNQFESLNALRQQVDKENLDVKIIIKILFTQITINLDQENEYVKHSTLDYIEELIALLPGNTESDDNLIALIVQMNEKYKQSLQHTDLYSQDYIERLKDECRIYTILDRLKTYFKSTNHLCTIYLLMIEYIYYKISDQSSITLIDCYCKYIYMNDILNHARTRASLCQIYHLALHDYYYQARDLMLMCHLQDTIHSSDILTQILYNRTMIQLGLCAFRCGKIFEAHQALVDFQSGNRIKELLGQDIHLPYHMHINLQLIECIYFISAMLIEIPSIRKHVISKRFYNLMLRAEKQTILGPPESMQEHIIAASQAMKAADWKICINYLINEKMKNIVSLSKIKSIYFKS